MIYLNLNENINYEIDYINNEIVANCNNIEILSSTLLNLPFSLFFAYRKNELLLHASGIINNIGNLVTISGEKGSGKSTVTSALLKYNNKFFSDDTILIKLFKNEIFCFQGGKILKLNIDTFKTNYKNENFNLYRKNIQGKAIITLDNIHNEKFNLSNIVLLNRSKEQFNIKKIENKLTKKFIILSNIVGTSVFGFRYCKLIEDKELLKILIDCINLYKINLYNDLQYLDDNIIKLNSFISNI